MEDHWAALIKFPHCNMLEHFLSLCVACLLFFIHICMPRGQKNVYLFFMYAEFQQAIFCVSFSPIRGTIEHYLCVMLACNLFFCLAVLMALT